MLDEATGARGNEEIGHVTMVVGHLVAAYFVNAMTFDFIMALLYHLFASVTGPWSSAAGLAGTALFTVACVVWAFPDVLCGANGRHLRLFFAVLVRYLLPWIVLRLLWMPGSYLLCVVMKTAFARRCSRAEFLNYVQLALGVVCLVWAVRNAGMIEEWECQVGCLWRRSSVYRCLFGPQCCGEDESAGCPSCPCSSRSVTLVFDSEEPLSGNCPSRRRRSRTRSRTPRRSCQH